MASGLKQYLFISALFLLGGGCSSNAPTQPNDAPREVVTERNPNGVDPNDPIITSGVKPWEKARLNLPEMQWTPDPLGASASQNFLTSGEAARGSTCMGMGTIGC